MISTEILRSQKAFTSCRSRDFQRDLVAKSASIQPKKKRMWPAPLLTGLTPFFSNREQCLLSATAVASYRPELTAPDTAHGIDFRHMVILRDLNDIFGYIELFFDQ